MACHGSTGRCFSFAEHQSASVRIKKTWCFTMSFLIRTINEDVLQPKIHPGAPMSSHFRKPHHLQHSHVKPSSQASPPTTLPCQAIFASLTTYNTPMSIHLRKPSHLQHSHVNPSSQTSPPTTLPCQSTFASLTHRKHFHPNPPSQASPPRTYLIPIL
jgi:hypothetical protein